MRAKMLPEQPVEQASIEAKEGGAGDVGVDDESLDKHATEECSVEQANGMGCVNKESLLGSEGADEHIDPIIQSDVDQMSAVGDPGHLEKPTLAGNNETFATEKNIPSVMNKSYEEEDGEKEDYESLDDDESERRTPSTDMEDVDLVEDEFFSGSANRSSSTSSNGSGLISPASKEAFGFLITAMRDLLGDDARNVSDAILRQYICWKPDVHRAVERFRAHDKFLKDNFNTRTLLLSVNPKVCYLLRNGMVLAPEELIDKNGSAVMVIRASKCDFSVQHGCSETDASRAIFFTIQQMLERKTLDTLLGGIVIILDLVDCVRKNISGKLIKMLSNAAGCFPIRIKAIFVVAMPWWFPSNNKRLLSTKLRERIHFLKDKAALSEYIDEDRLLEEDGGIYNFDLQAWISTTLSAEVGMKSSN